MSAGAEAATDLVRVLVVDDTDTLRRMVTTALRKNGRFDVVGEASNGVEGLTVAGRERPDLVLLDLSMPVMDGATALPQLRELLPAALIVVFSGFEHHELRPALSASGASAFIEKGTPLSRVAAQLVELWEARPGS